jgi:hypothetical protein
MLDDMHLVKTLQSIVLASVALLHKEDFTVGTFTQLIEELEAVFGYLLVLVNEELRLSGLK